MDRTERIRLRRFQLAECRRLNRVSERLGAAAIVSVPVLIAVSIVLNRPAVVWIGLPVLLVIAAVYFRALATAAMHKAKSLRRTNV